MTTSEDIVESQAATALRSLGETAEDVATILQFGGWLGFRSNSSSCPVAMYLSTVVPNAISAAVGSDQATIHVVDGADVEVDLTPAVAGFVLAFDIGAYPELIAQDVDDNGDVIDE